MFKILYLNPVTGEEELTIRLSYIDAINCCIVNKGIIVA